MAWPSPSRLLRNDASSAFISSPFVSSASMRVAAPPAPNALTPSSAWSMAACSARMSSTLATSSSYSERIVWRMRAATSAASRSRAGSATGRAASTSLRFQRRAGTGAAASTGAGLSAAVFVGLGEGDQARLRRRVQVGMAHRSSSLMAWFIGVAR